MFKILGINKRICIQFNEFPVFNFGVGEVFESKNGGFKDLFSGKSWVPVFFGNPYLPFIIMTAFCPFPQHISDNPVKFPEGHA